MLILLGILLNEIEFLQIYLFSLLSNLQVYLIEFLNHILSSFWLCLSDTAEFCSNFILHFNCLATLDSIAVFKSHWIWFVRQTCHLKALQQYSAFCWRETIARLALWIEFNNTSLWKLLVAMGYLSILNASIVFLLPWANKAYTLFIEFILY